MHLTEIAGLVARRRWTDREQWTTCHLGSLRVGAVFALPDERPLRPVVLAEAPRREDVPDHISPHMNKESAGLLIGEARYLDTGEPTDFKLRADTSVLTRCDLHYTTNAR
ncbi:hypothetical protein [Streptomyces malaysiensis]|uniref:Uncharacterized protein n=1 Tax=Streptomyces malaysiensis subsp. samsunensis TaxID=459658 RepID=A0A9X2LTY3_STRMQ|nr:hypothetical protein [Streptomyces samsunensis]MCQ8830375.1 hypothetical protein [Streptomyces samsunensis]